MEIAFVTSKGQLVIPARLRRRYGIKPGTKVCFIERDNEILFQPVTKEYIRSVRGMLKSHTSVTQELLKERGKDKEREEANMALQKKAEIYTGDPEFRTVEKEIHIIWL